MKTGGATMSQSCTPVMLYCGVTRSESEPDTETRQEELENSATSP